MNELIIQITAWLHIPGGMKKKGKIKRRKKGFFLASRPMNWK